MQFRTVCVISVHVGIENNHMSHDSEALTIYRFLELGLGLGLGQIRVKTWFQVRIRVKIRVRVRIGINVGFW